MKTRILFITITLFFLSLSVNAQLRCTRSVGSSEARLVIDEIKAYGTSQNFPNTPVPNAQDNINVYFHVELCLNRRDRLDFNRFMQGATTQNLILDFDVNHTTDFHCVQWVCLNCVSSDQISSQSTSNGGTNYILNLNLNPNGMRPLITSTIVMPMPPQSGVDFEAIITPNSATASNDNNSISLPFSGDDMEVLLSNPGSNPCYTGNKPGYVGTSKNADGKGGNLQEMMIAPNPVTGPLQVALPLAEHGWTLEVFNMNGQVVLSEFHADQGIQMDLSSLPKGVYQLRARSDEMFFVEPVVIQ